MNPVAEKAYQQIIRQQQTRIAELEKKIAELSALVAWLKGAGHCSFSTRARFCRDVLGLSLSRGQLAKVLGKAGVATRSQRGRRWCQRTWTATATCAQQNRSVFEYLHQTLVAHFASLPTPSLLPAGP